MNYLFNNSIIRILKIIEIQEFTVSLPSKFSSSSSKLLYIKIPSKVKIILKLKKISSELFLIAVGLNKY